MRWPDKLKGTKTFVEYGEERSIVWNCNPEKKIWRFLLKMVAMATSHTHLRFQFRALIALTPIISALLKNKIQWLSNKHILYKSLYRSVLSTKVWRLTLVFITFFAGFIWKQPYCAPNPVHKSYCVTWQMLTAAIFQLIASRHCSIFDYPKFQEFLFNTL